MNTKYAINSKEFRLAIFIIIATFLARFTGYEVEADLLDLYDAYNQQFA